MILEDLVEKAILVNQAYPDQEVYKADLAVIMFLDTAMH